MISERLEMKHKELLFEKLRQITIPISEYSFPNLYLFRDSHDYEVIIDKEIFVKGTSYDGHAYLMPTRAIHHMEYEYVKEMMTNVEFLFPIPEEWLSYFDGRMYEFSYMEGETDYIYTVEKLSMYSGRKLSKKRNLLKQFLNSYRHDAAPLTGDHREEAKNIVETWKKESSQEAVDTDYLPCLEALEKSEELMLCGVIYYAEMEPAGFILGEEINSETFVIHFAKATRKFKGIYQYMFNSFARILPVTYTYLNFEQDLAQAALRIAKISYVPDRMVKKMRVSLKKTHQ
ncbi:MAG: DUF2156 domain-containing protein [Nitrospiraceae bacterium]|nr:MAG: DUF2156 domain-containing protein [Nitrospiraceae bacterium]